MKAHGFLVGWLLAAGWSCALAQTKVDLRTQSKSIDFTGASLTKPARSAASLPGACSAGELFYLSSGPLYSCSSTNNWVRMGTVTGNTNSGDCARFDANGNVVDGGAACGGGPNFQQAFASATSVTLTHNLNSTGIVFACFDNSTPPLWILPRSVALTNPNTLTVNFASAQSGSCVVNANGAGSTPNFQQAFTSATTVTLAHNLNSTSIVFTCFDTSTPPLWILPKSAALTNANSLTVNFASAQSGSCAVNATGGGAEPAFLMGSASLSFGPIAQAACAELTFTLTGVNPGDSIAPGWPATLTAGLTGTMIATAANTVAVELCNLSGATVTPAAQTFKATVIH
ncbi:MAG TPA: hypothetical protein VK335_07370 [Bryobacteraceae bacterium]|nr:hypothetical protein [Bryobacteraceae bacterium]